MYQFTSENEHSVPVSHHICDTCKNEFSICPAPSDLSTGIWDDCQSDICASYDPHRDADLLFMTDKQIAKEKKVVSIQKLRERK